MLNISLFCEVTRHWFIQHQHALPLIKFVPTFPSMDEITFMAMQLHALNFHETFKIKRRFDLFFLKKKNSKIVRK
jgi:hypothetical protein